MRPQYLADFRRYPFLNEALESQASRLRLQPYPLPCESHKMRSRNTDVSLTSVPGPLRHIAVAGFINTNRRFTCPRASRCWQRSVSSLPLQPAQAVRPKKNTLLSSPHRFRSSPYTPASTSNAVAGQASAPVLISTLSVTPAIGRGV